MALASAFLLLSTAKTSGKGYGLGRRKLVFGGSFGDYGGFYDTFSSYFGSFGTLSAGNFGVDNSYDTQEVPPVVVDSLDAIPGCTNEDATNYNQDATLDDGTCEFPPVVVDSLDAIPGCTNEDATNYNQDATMDDGT